MKPLLFEGTFFEFPVYFALYLLAFLGAIILATHRAKKFSVSPVRAIDAGLAAFLGGFLGSRLFHVLFEYPEYYLKDPLKVFYFWQGGFVLYGGLIVGTVSVVSFLLYHHEKLLRWGDLAAPCMFLGIVTGKQIGRAHV